MIPVTTGTTDGTSFSAPQIAALMARIKATNPNLAPSQIERILAQSASLPNGASPFQLGFGQVNLAGFA